MGYFLSYFMQVLFFTCVPFLVFGTLVWFCRRLFVFFVGEWRGRRVLLAAFALSTPLRELGHVLAALLFFHRVTDVRFLSLRDQNGELGYVEHSYNPRNPVALLGNFFYALAPMVVGLFAVFALFSLCFGNVMQQFFVQISLLAEQGGGFAEYFSAALGLIPAMLQAPSGVGLKILGFALLLLLCMGIFLAIEELMDAFSGMLIYAGLAAVLTAITLLFDSRVSGIVLDALRGFAASVTALCVAVLLAVAVLLVLGALLWVWHILFGDHTQETALAEYKD